MLVRYTRTAGGNTAMTDYLNSFAHPIDGGLWDKASVNPKMEEIFKDPTRRKRQPSRDHHSRRHRSPSPQHRYHSRSPDRSAPSILFVLLALHYNSLGIEDGENNREGAPMPQV